jgi:gamma-glutamyltranspeptidase / glutathione hydrolase
VLRNPELAALLRGIAARGRAGFDDGAAGRAVIQALNAGGNPATLHDLASFEPEWKRPLCAEWRGHVLLSAPPPQTGAQVIHTLKLLEPFDLPALGLPTHSARAFDVIVSALRIGIADNRGNDDPRWTTVHAAERISDAFVRERRPLVGTGAAAAAIDAADPSRHGSAPAAACAPLRPWPAVAHDTGATNQAERFGGAAVAGAAPAAKALAP